MTDLNRNPDSSQNNNQAANNFIKTIIANDKANNANKTIVTRFPPEPNGYLHIGHVKSIYLNFGMAQEFGGACFLRFDDTNPATEKQDYIDSIKQDVRWLGFEWQGAVRFASDYFDQLHAWAIQLIEQGDAYVDLQTPDEIRQNRGSFREKGVESPYRNATIGDNLARFAAMKNGEFESGAAVLRAKIDMAHPNMTLRDPVLYRVLHQAHHQTGDKWCIYPMYDYAHPLSDAIEGVSHSLCTLEFEEHRPFYEWVLDKVGAPFNGGESANEFSNIPVQYEFSRLNLNGVLTSKRKLKQLVEMGAVSGWDDPRMPTIAGMRRRGYPAAALRDFCARVGVSRADGVVDFRQLEFSVRAALEETAGRAMVVKKPLKVTIANFAQATAQADSLKKPTVISRLAKADAATGETVLWLTQKTHPNQENSKTRELAFTQTIFIDEGDFSLNPPAGYKRLTPDNNEIRLRNSYILKITEHKTDDSGKVIELIGEIDAKTLGNNPEGRKVKGVIHWVSATLGVPVLLREYQPLILENLVDAGAADATEENDTADTLVDINPNSVIEYHAIAEPSLADAQVGEVFQFERESFFVVDKDSTATQKVFNQVVSLKDGFK